MKYLFAFQRLLFLLCFLFFTTTMKAQTVSKVSGTVTDAQGAPLAGVSVNVKGTNVSTMTDDEGRFSLNAGSTATLVFSSVGFNNEEVEVSGKTVINLSLKSTAASLQDVVVVGYGTQKKATLTGSVVTVGGNELRKSPAPNISNSLGGRLPGLVVVSRTGEPGNDGSLLRIRGVNTLGDNSPLVIVDGIQNRGLDRIDPAYIESITVLKDASAAIYGSEAANGVILVTTKRGKSGKPQIQINLRQGYNQPTVLPKMADAAGYAEMINDIKMYQGQPAKYSDEDIQKYKTVQIPGVIQTPIGSMQSSSPGLHRIMPMSR